MTADILEQSIMRSRESPVLEMAHALGGVPLVYSGLRHAMGQKHYRQNFIDRNVGEHRFGRILDLGCGTGQMAHYFQEADEYVGIDDNPRYINYASKRGTKNQRFLKGDITTLPTKSLGRFDCIVLMGVMHHLSDDQVNKVLERSTCLLKEGAIIATTDCVRRLDSHWSANFMIEHDRGKYVRNEVGYMALLTEHFDDVRGQEMLDGLRVPLTRAIYPQFTTTSKI